MNIQLKGWKAIAALAVIAAIFGGKFLMERRTLGLEVAEELLGLARIELPSIQARGRGDDVVVRVEIRVDGKEPPEGESVRYYRMSHSALTGWRVRRETTALSYYLKLF